MPQRIIEETASLEDSAPPARCDTEITRRSFLRLLKAAAIKWVDDNAFRLSASLGFYTIFSIAPLLIIVVSMGAWLFGPEAAQGQIVAQIHDLIGPQGAEAVQAILKSAHQQEESSILAAVIGVATLLIGATAVFSELQDALNVIWKVPPKKSENILVSTIKSRVLSFAMILGVGFLLVVSLVLSALVAAALSFVGDFGMAIVGRAASMFVSFAVITLLFAMIFKALPDVDIAWQDVWIGSAVTSLLFNVGKYFIGLYLGHGSVASAYGAAGSFVVLIFWVYYSSLILFFGAELTQVYASRCGSQVRGLPERV